MTLHELEATIRTLQERHTNLDEGMLETLLRAGGWEQKDIREAVTLYRSGAASQAALPPLAEESVFVPPPKEDHLLPAGASAPKPEPESLIPPSPEKARKDELPHNLPLRPFETSEHIWPFSRYKDVFYGDLPEEEPQENERKPEQEKETPVPLVAEPIPPPEPEPVIVPPSAVPQLEQPEKTPPHLASKPERPAPEAHGEDNLVMIASVMLLLILLLLGYMYGNGRL